MNCLEEVQASASAGRCTSAEEDAAIEAVGGAQSAVYGELTALGLRALGVRLSIQPSDRFADLGSGLGRIVFQAVRDFGVAHATGVEMAATRHDLAVESLAKQPEQVASRVHLVQGNCVDAELWASSGALSDVSVVFVASLVYICG
jgi:precorrin-6B methylase 2